MKRSPHAAPTAAGPSQRQLRVGELVRHAISDVLSRGDVPDPALKGVLVTVPEVRMTPDLKLATCYIMPLGGKEPEKVAATLERLRKPLRAELARRVELKSVPDLRFLVDTSFAEGDRIDALLRSPQVKRDLDAEKPTDDGDDA